MNKTDEAWNQIKKSERVNVNEVYTKWAETYDKDVLNILGCSSKGELVKSTLAHIKNDKSTLVLDLAAGTGIIGQMFRDQGYKGIIDGVEPNLSMLKKAQEKGIYRNCICSKLSAEDEISLDKGVYDALTIAGAMMPFHIDPNGIQSTIPLLKRGGVLAFYARESGEDYGEYRVKLEKVLQGLVEERKLEIIQQKTVLHFRNQKLESGEDVNVVLYTCMKI